MSQLLFPELFELEIESWRGGIEANQKQIGSKDIHNITKEIASIFEMSIQHNYVFDLPLIANKFSRASNGKVNPKEIAFYILSIIPHPSNFNEEEKKTLLQIINQTEHEFGGAKERLQKRWYQKTA
ncbi:MAG: hypothetical protein WD512_16445 [Candidatus Paceibacterota bacterium]